MNNNLPNIDSNLKQIALDEGLPEEDLSKIFILLPIGDSGDITYLDAAGQCILNISSLVDETFSNLNQTQKTAVKLRLMSKLLSLKADQLIRA